MSPAAKETEREMVGHPSSETTEKCPPNPLRVSLIIAVYKRADFLQLVLPSVACQSFRDMEVIIAEDDRSETIKELIHKRKETFPFPIVHVSHEDRGFRKNKILNKAVLASMGGHLIFIDGDCILHRKFIEEHVKRLEPDTCLFGRRAMISDKLTKKLIREGNIDSLSLVSMFLTGTGHIENGIYAPWLHSTRKYGVKGCNFSLSRDLLYRINGFDEDFEKPIGGEDTDIERRLRLINANFKCTKFKTVQYHLYHGGREGREEYRQVEGKALKERKIKEGLSYCKNGLFRQ